MESGEPDDADGIEDGSPFDKRCSSCSLSGMFASPRDNFTPSRNWARACASWVNDWVGLVGKNDGDDGDDGDDGEDDDDVGDVCTPGSKCPTYWSSTKNSRNIV